MRLACGVTSHPTPVGRRCPAIRWRPPTPVRRARPRDAAAITRGRDATWPASHRGRKPSRHPSSSLDESGVSPLPRVVRTDAPVGQTPILRAWWTRDPRSAIRAISPEGTLSCSCQDHALHAAEVIALLEPRLRAVPSRLVLMWAGAPMHRRHVIQEGLAQGAAPRLHRERLPA